MKKYEECAVFIRKQRITVAKNERKMEYTFNNSLIELTQRIVNANSSVKAQIRQKELQAKYDQMLLEEDLINGK